MKQDATSLDRLHDIVLPPQVPWWPPAPGWSVLLMLGALAVLWFAWRGWRRRRADAYRREALRELPRLEDSTAIAELLRRTALRVTPREVVAALNGAAWADWLAARSDVTMTDGVRRQLAAGVYARPEGRLDPEPLRAYAAGWIAGHARPAQGDPAGPRTQEETSC